MLGIKSITSELLALLDESLYYRLINTNQSHLRVRLNMYVCVCNAVTDRDIKKAIAQGHDTFDKVCCQLKVASCCGRCQCMARQIIDEATQEQSIYSANDLGIAFA